MKLLVFAHTPPPHHGQSYMVRLMLEGMGGDCRKAVYSTLNSPTNPGGIECDYVTIGAVKATYKDLLLVPLSCVRAIWFRFVHGATALYYIPSAGGYLGLFRDWLVMLLCRPFFKSTILYWREKGLARWLETCTSIRTRTLTYHLLKEADVSLVPSKEALADAEKFYPKNIAVVGDDLPEP